MIVEKNYLVNIILVAFFCKWTTKNKIILTFYFLIKTLNFAAIHHEDYEMS